MRVQLNSLEVVAMNGSKSSKNRVKEIVNDIRHIQKIANDKEKGSGKYITDRCNAIARREHKSLGVIVDKKTGDLKSEPACSYRYYSHLMETYRNAIKSLNLKHHSIDYHINVFIRKYKDKKPEIVKMLDPSLPIEKLRDNIILLRADSITGSEYKKDLLSLNVEHHSYYLFEPKGAVKDWIKDDDSKQLSKKLHNQIVVNPKWIKDLSLILLTKESPSDSDLCVGLALSTGRRLTEIMKTAKVKMVDDRTLLFSGQLKTKNRHLFESVKPYNIPTLIDAKIVLQAFKTLRKATRKDKLKFTDVQGNEVESMVKDGDIKDYDHNKAVHRKYERTMNSAVRMNLQNGNFSLKDCRALYTEITYENHKLPGEARSAYRHRVLGHSMIETQLHYEAFQISESVKTIELSADQEEPKGNAKPVVSNDLIEYLEKADSKIMDYTRAPKMQIVHNWLKTEVSDNGLPHNEITASYIRRHCLIDGKQLNHNTVKKYLDEFVEISNFQANIDAEE